jgi:general stress protein 26
MATPETDIDARFGSDGAEPTPWPDARSTIEAAPVWWITTVRADGRPHVTPLLAVWQDDALHFCTGPEEQKARNLEANPNCALTTGVNTQDDGLDVVVEGEAVRVTDEARLRRLADAWVAKYGEEWRFDVRDHGFVHGEDSTEDDPGPALVFEVAPRQAFGFGKGEVFSQTRWRFSPGS